VSETIGAWLPDEKAQVFHKEARQLESSYAMLSVSLDEAIELWQLGHSGKSLQAVGVTSSLCKLLTQTLAGKLALWRKWSRILA